MQPGLSEMRRSSSLRIDVLEMPTAAEDRQQHRQSSPEQREPAGGCGGGARSRPFPPSAAAHHQVPTPLADALCSDVPAHHGVQPPSAHKTITSAIHGNEPHNNTQTHSARPQSLTQTRVFLHNTRATTAPATMDECPDGRDSAVPASGQEFESLFSSSSPTHSKSASPSLLFLDLGSAFRDLLDPPPLSSACSTTTTAASSSTRTSALFKEGLQQLESIQELNATALLHSQKFSGFNADYYDTTTASTISPDDTNRFSFFSSVSSAPDDPDVDGASFLYCDESDACISTTASPAFPSFLKNPTTAMAPAEPFSAASTRPGWTLKKPTSAGPESANRMSPTTPKATKTHSRNRSRSTSPLIFWNRKGAQRGQQQEAGLAEVSEDVDHEWLPALDDREDALDSVSNHLGRIAESTRTQSRSGSGAGTPNGWRDLIEPLDDEADESSAAQPSRLITREHYLALPPAIQRKYFSPIERLQFTQESSEVDRIYDHYDLTASQNPKHRRHRPAHSSPDFFYTLPPNISSLHPHHHNNSINHNVRESHVTASSETSWVIHYPEKASKLDLTREEQVNLIKHLRASVILDAASEAIRNSTPTPDIDHSTATLSSRRGSSDSMASVIVGDSDPMANGRDTVRESLYDSFRWLDEEEELNLGLFLDDYHANLREDVPQTGKNRRPSFRRHLSISKLPFGRPSFSSSHVDPASPLQSPTKSQNPNGGQRRLSRTLSLIHSSKHSHSDSVPIVDPSAAHYQDPEARQRLRTFASPSKFDEALQYGFPATDAAERPISLDKKLPALPKVSNESENMRSFMDFGGDEDEVSDTDDASSIRDPESPKTPQMGGLTPPPGHHHPTRVTTDPCSLDSVPRSTSAVGFSKVDSHIASQGLAREMTLRMTLTRPDLRANEELIYGWQPQAAYLNAGRRRSTTHPIKTVTTDIHHTSAPAPAPASTTSSNHAQGASTTTACWSEGQQSKDSIEAMFAGLDHWSAENATGDRGTGLKRFWNKVRRT